MLSVKKHIDVIALLVIMLGLFTISRSSHFRMFPDAIQAQGIAGESGRCDATDRLLTGLAFLLNQ
jgi:hypothetical protein